MSKENIKRKSPNLIQLGRRAKKLRETKNLTIVQLAEMARVNKNTILRFEHGENTTVDTIDKICKVLGTTFGDLHTSKIEEGRDYKKLVKKYHRKERVMNDEKPGMLIGDLSYKLPGGSMRSMVMEIRRESKMRSHDGEELLFCLTGRVGVTISNKKFTLNKGDALFFWGSEPHQYRNMLDDYVSVALSVVCGKDIESLDVSHIE